MGFLMKFPFMYIIIIIQNNGVFISGFKSSFLLIWQSLLSILSIVYIFNRKLGFRDHCYPDNTKGGRKKERANVWGTGKHQRERGPAKETIWEWETERGWEEEKAKKKCAHKRKTHENTESKCGIVKGKRGRARQGEIKST